MIQKKEAEELKSQLDAYSVLRWLGYEKSKPMKSQNQIRDFCPMHGGTNQRSLAINTYSGAFKCHSCGNEGGDLITLWCKTKGLKFNEAVRELKQILRCLPQRQADAWKWKTDNPLQREEKDEKALEKSRAIAVEIISKWTQSPPKEKHVAYFESKGINLPDGVLYGEDEKGSQYNVIPFYDVKGRLQTVQYVQKGAPKRFAKNTKASGAFFPLGLTRWNAHKIIYLSEGIATACSVFEALKKASPVLSCGSATNIANVANAIRKEYPSTILTVCLDDDDAGDAVMEKIEALNLPNISFCHPDFSGIDRRKDENGKILDKDFNDIHQRLGIESVAKQLDKETWASKEQEQRNEILSSGLIGLDFVEDYYQNLPDGIDIGLKTGEGIHDKILLPSGGYTAFCAPTKHGKTTALVNVVERFLRKNPRDSAIYLTLEELSPPIVVRFMSRFLNEELSKNNVNTIISYFRSKEKHLEMFSKEWKKMSRDNGSSENLFLKNVRLFEDSYLKNGRLRILNFNSYGGSISRIESLCDEIVKFNKWIPNLRLIAIDYLQLLELKKPWNKSRDESLKEVCLQLKDIAARTGLTIVTAAQFNRTVQNEDDLHPAAIGEAGSIERHASMAIGMWNRRFRQFDGGKPIKQEPADEMLLNIMLNRYGPSNQKLVAHYNGNIGLIDFENAKMETEKKHNDSSERRLVAEKNK